MPGKVKVRIFAGRNLPVMDKSSETSDAYVEIKLGTTTYKTDVCRKTLNPNWNTEWFKFEVDDLELQDEPLQIRIMDYDTYSANDSIGRVYIDLGPLLLPQNSGSTMSGWIPIFDTMHGIRGEINVAVKVDLFSDFNRFRQSSCGVQFFVVPPGIPQGYRVYAFQGFVEELVINDDPEYQWIDKIRTPRASNEARQILFSKLSGEVKRKIGLKAVELGGNAVLGYQLRFDMEGESGIVVRGIGTAATISRQVQDVSQISPNRIKDGSRESYQDFSQNSRIIVTRSKNSVKSSRFSRPRHSLFPSSRYLHRFRPRSQSATLDDVTFPNLPFSHQSESPGSWSPTRSSPESMVIVIPNSSSPTNSSAPTSPTGFQPCDFAPGDCCSHSPVCSRSLLPEETLASPPKMSHPKATVTSVTGCLCRRSSDSELNTWLKVDPASNKSSRQTESVDMLEYPFFSITRFPLGFILHVGGVVSASSVKLLGRINNPEPEARDSWWTEIRMEIRSHARALGCNVVLGYSESTSICDDICVLSACGTAAVVRLHQIDSNVERKEDWPRKMQIDHDECSMCHIPYSESSMPFPVTLSRCAVCRKSKVPDVIFATIFPPSTLAIIGKGCLVQARVCRLKKDCKGEANAKEISDSLPFLQYELHRQLLNKMKVKGMNSLFALSVQVTIGAKTLIAVATATAVFISALPSPQIPKISWSKSTEEESKLNDMQQQVSDIVMKNRELYKLESVINDVEQLSIKDENDDENEDLAELDLSSGNKDACVLEMDDSEDMYDIWTLINDLAIPRDFEIVNTEVVPGIDNLVRNLQMFCRVFRLKLPAGLSCQKLSQYLDNTIQSLFFKLRKMVPCAICRLQFMVDLPEDDELQVTTCGIAIGLGEPPPSKQTKDSHSTEMIFSMDEEQVKLKPKRIPFYHRAKKECVGIDITPLSYIPGAPIDKYLGNLNWFFIRESTSVRENGGFGGFVQSFVAEVLAIIRAQVAALGGNALVSYFMNECVLLNNPHKNQGQCLVNVGGDVVQILTSMNIQLTRPTDLTVKPADCN